MWDQAAALFDQALANARGQKNFMGEVARLFNSSKHLLDNALKHVERFVVDTIAKFAPTLNELAEKAADWVSKAIGPLLASVRPIIVGLKKWLNKNAKKMEMCVL